MCALADWRYGQIGNTSTATHFFVTALGGASCSLLASALYALIAEVIELRKSDGMRGRFLSTFAARTNNTTLWKGRPEPPSRLFPPSTDKMVASASAETDAATQPAPPKHIKPEKLYSTNDIDCMLHLMQLLIKQLNEAPTWTKVTAGDLPDLIDGINVVIGVFSNPLTHAIAKSNQNLFKIETTNNNHEVVAIAKPSLNDQNTFEQCMEPNGRAYLLKCVFQDKIVVVVGGLTAEDTTRVGKFLNNSWETLPTNDIRNLPLENHEFLMEFDTTGSGCVHVYTLRGEQLFK